jgi:hypothetical protein
MQKKQQLPFWSFRDGRRKKELQISGVLLVFSHHDTRTNSFVVDRIMISKTPVQDIIA